MPCVQVLNASKSFATVRVTRCATAYAKPGWLGGHRDVSQLAACLAEADVGFSTDGGAWAQVWGQPGGGVGCGASREVG